MKILVITHNFPTALNPASGIFAARQIEALVANGVEVTVLVPLVWCPAALRRFRRWRHYDHTVVPRYRNVVAIPVGYIRLPGSWFRLIADKVVLSVLSKKAEDLNTQHRFDMVYARFLYPEGYAAARLAERWGVPAIGVGAGSEVNAYTLESELFRRNIVRTMRRFDQLIASGAEVARNIWSMSGRRATIIQGVVDTNAFHPVDAQLKRQIRESLGLPKGKTILLYVGALKEAKGVFELIEAFASLEKKQDTVFMVFCGAGSAERRMRASVERLGLKGGTLFAGAIDPDDVCPWMQAADVFVFPSHSEGMPNAVMEAMAVGLPVVTTRVGGIPDALAGCKGAFLIEPKSSRALTEALEDVLADDLAREEMGKASRRKALLEFSVQNNASTLLQCFAEALERKRLGGSGIDTHRS